MQQEKAPRLSIVVAIARNRAIGKENKLLWHLSDDLKRFKALTSGHTIVMGRKTYESLPKRPLPDRYHIVLSTSVRMKEENVRPVASLQEALAALPGDEEAFVIGGGQIYRMFLPYCQKAYVTEIRADFEADTFFPELSPEEWMVGEAGDWRRDSATGLDYRYVTYVRKQEKTTERV